MQKHDAHDVPQFSRLNEGEGAPLYEVVKRHISESILQGELPAGTILPSENSLAAKFGVSVGTVRKALAALTTEGMLMRRRKTGTVVTGWRRCITSAISFTIFVYMTKRAVCCSRRRDCWSISTAAPAPTRPISCRSQRVTQ